MGPKKKKNLLAFQVHCLMLFFKLPYTFEKTLCPDLVLIAYNGVNCECFFFFGYVCTKEEREEFELLTFALRDVILCRLSYPLRIEL
jgi:hypothetical protein